MGRRGQVSLEVVLLVAFAIAAVVITITVVTNNIIEPAESQNANQTQNLFDYLRNTSEEFTATATAAVTAFFFDTNSTHFNQGVFDNTSVSGVGNEANVALWQPPAVNSSEQVLYLKFDNSAAFGENATLAYDYSGNGRNGTITGAPYVEGKFGKAVSFNHRFLEPTPVASPGPGLDDKVEVSNIDAATDLGATYTFEAWVKYDGFYSGSSGFLGDATIIAFGAGQPTWWGVGSNGGLYYYAGTLVISTSSSSVPIRKWVHLVYTWDGAESKFYINGTLAASNSNAPGAYGTGLVMGSDDYDDLWYGPIDNVVIYNRSLSASEVLDHYEKGSFAHGDFERVFDAGGTADWSFINWTTPVAYRQEFSSNPADQLVYWKFNNNPAYGEGATVAYDYSGNGNNGTITGAVYADGRFGNALQFNTAYFGPSPSPIPSPGPAGDSVTGNVDSSDLASQYSYEAWVRFEASDYSYCYCTIINFGNDNPWFGLNPSGKLQYWDASNVVVQTGTAAIPLGNWTHVAYVWDGSFNYLYINGLLRATSSSVPSFSGTELMVGNSPYYIEIWPGSIDNVVIHNHALSASEVLDHYEQGILDLTFQTATSSDNSAYSSFSSVYYANQSNGTAIGGSSRYLKYLANFSTEDVTYTPLLESVAVNNTG